MTVAPSALHTDALSVLHAWTPPSAEQDAVRRRYLDHLAAEPDGAYRSCFPDHLTAGVLVLAHDLDAVLLNLHGKARRWFAFGGHCESGDSTLAGAALREATEESGLPSVDLSPTPVHLSEHPVDFCDPRGPVQHLDVRFAARAPEGGVPVTSAESLDVRWWPIDGLPDLPDEMLALIGLARERFAS